MNITKIKARQIFDSRGYPTVETDVYLADGSMGRAAVPSGASTGSHEAVELRDNEKAYGGQGVTKAIGNILEIIAPKLIGMSAYDQQAIDKTLIALDGSENKGVLGANAILAVSLATAKAAACGKGQPFFRYVADTYRTGEMVMPLPMANIVNGGKHAVGSTTIQEFMIVPIGAQTIQQALQLCSEVFHTLGKVLIKKGYQATVGDEGGYAPQLKGGNRETLELICDAIERAGYKPGKDVALAIDVAATEIYANGVYAIEKNRALNADALIDWYSEITNQFPIVSIEDGLAEDDWPHWSKLCQKLGKKIQVVGDDLLVTNTHLLSRAVKEQSANAILIKPNQIGTLTETVEAVRAAQDAGWRTIVSHRSGETEDVTIAHLAVGLAAGQIKTGSFSRSERLAKYNELLRIHELAPHAMLYKF